VNTLSWPLLMYGAADRGGAAAGQSHIPANFQASAAANPQLEALP